MSNKLPQFTSSSRPKIIIFNPASFDNAIAILEDNKIKCKKESEEVISIARSNESKARKILKRYNMDFSII